MSQDKAITGDVHAAREKREGDDVVLLPEEKNLLRHSDDPLVKEWVKLRNEFDDYRQGALTVLPAFLINNSSNIIGAAHVATEVAMFKSSLARGDKLVEHANNPIDYVTKAIGRVFSVTFDKSIPKNFNLTTLRGEDGKGSVIKGLYRFITDTDWATKRAMVEQGVSRVEDLKLTNPWQARTTMFGLAAWSLAALIPDKKDSPEEIEKMALLQQTNPLGYVGERLRQAVWFPEWHEHKRQMIGLGYIGVGTCSTLGSWRGNGIKGYGFNKNYFLTSMFSLAAAFPLLFASDDEKGYGGYGLLTMGRMFFLPGSIANKFARGEPGAGWYTGASVSFQLENYLQTLIGGAEKKSDGTIVDHQEIFKHAKRQAQVIKQRKSVDKEEVPATHIQDVAEHVPPEKALAKGT